MNEISGAPIEPTPVDDVRCIRERFDREANGNVHLLAEEAQRAAARYRKELGLRSVPSPASEPAATNRDTA